MSIMWRQIYSVCERDRQIAAQHYTNTQYSAIYSDSSWIMHGLAWIKCAGPCRLEIIIIIKIVTSLSLPFAILHENYAVLHHTVSSKIYFKTILLSIIVLGFKISLRYYLSLCYTREYKKIKMMYVWKKQCFGLRSIFYNLYSDVLFLLDPNQLHVSTMIWISSNNLRCILMETSI